MERIFYTLITLVMLVVLPSLLKAETNDAKAKAAFERGTELFSKKQYAEAADAFTMAYKSKPTWKLLYNIAQAQGGAKHYGLALESFEKYLSQAGDDISADRQESILEEIRKLRDMVGDVSITGPSGAVLRVDNIERGTLPLTGPVAISAGIDHMFVVKLNGNVLLEKSMMVRGRSREELVVPDEKTEDNVTGDDQATVVPQDEKNSTELNASDESSASSASSRKLKTAGLVLAVTGGAALIAGIITGGVALSKEGELDDKCNDDLVCYGGGTSDIENTRDSMALASDILFIAGGVTAAVGIVLLAVGKKRERQNVTVNAAIGPNHAAILFGRTF